MTKVSIITPAFNAKDHLREAIESVLKQTYSNWELLIIDDGSVDATAQIARSAAKEDHRIVYYYQPNGKQGKARNLGLKKSTGELIAFLDADDIWLPNKLEIQVKEITEKNADLVFSDSYVFTDSDKDPFETRIQTDRGFFAGEKALELFFYRNRIPILTVLVKKESINSVGGFCENNDIQNAEDYHLWLKLLINGSKFWGSSETLSAYRLHGSSATASDKLVIKQVGAVLTNIGTDYPYLLQIIVDVLLRKNSEQQEELIRLAEEYRKSKNLSLLKAGNKLVNIFRSWKHH